MRTFNDYLWDESIIYYHGMSDDELYRRLNCLNINEDAEGGIDKFLFAGVPTKESKGDIHQYISQLRWMQRRPPAIIPLPQIHISIRFNSFTLVSHIEALKEGIDKIESFKRPTIIPVEDALLMGKNNTLFSFKFPQNDPNLNRANSFFNRVYYTITGDSKTFPLIPHMTLAKYVQDYPEGTKNHPQSLAITYMIVRGILAVP